MTERKRIAVVGSGAAGMMSAWSLNRRPENDVFLYEKNDYIGGHTNTVTVDYTDNSGQKKQVPIDTGFIVFNTLNYPNLVNFFKEVDVETVASDMSFAFSLTGKEHVEWSSDNVNTLFAQRSNIVSPSFWSMLLDMIKFNNEAVEVLNNPKFNGVTVGEYIRLRGYSDSFVRYYLLPMTGAVWSTPLTTMFEFPIQTMIHFMQNHCFMQLAGRPVWRTVKNGSIEYVKKIVQELKPENIRKNTSVTKIKRVSGKVHLFDDKGNEEVFDSVVLACHADQSREILREDITAEEEALLKDFKFKKNIAYLHSDPSLMPTRRNTWSSWNVLMKAEKIGDVSDDLCLTYYMNRLQPWLQDTGKDFFVTLNPITPPKPELTYKVIEYEHPVFLLENVAQQKRLESVQPPVLFCGAWGTFGFHEDAATSGLSVAERLGAPAPFPLSYARWHVPAVRPNRWPRRFFTAVTVGVLAVFASRMWRYLSGPNSSAAEGPAVMLYRLATEQVSRTGLFDAVRGLWRK